MIFLSGSGELCRISRTYNEEFDIDREDRDGFPKQMTYELRSALLEKIHEKSKEDNSRHQGQHVTNPCGQWKRGRTGD